MKDRIHYKVIEILTEIKETVWMGVRSNVISRAVLIISFMYNLPSNSRWYNPNFTKEFKEDINSSRDKYPNTEIVIMGDMTSRIGTRYTCHSTLLQ
jgi:hypothetical protein